MLSLVEKLVPRRSFLFEVDVNLVNFLWYADSLVSIDILLFLELLLETFVHPFSDLLVVNFGTHFLELFNGLNVRGRVDTLIADNLNLGQDFGWFS